MSTDEFDWNLPEQFNFTRDVVEVLAEDPNRRAFTAVDTTGIINRTTFAQLAQDATRWAHLLRSRATEPGDRVVVVAGKVPEWLGIMLGAIKSGLVTVPCPDMLRAGDLAFRVQHSEASLIVADRAVQGQIDAMRGAIDSPVDVLYLDDARLLLPRQPTTAPTEDTRWFDYAFILYTSGTTRNPKGVTHTHGYTFAKRMQAEHWLGARPGDLVWCTAGTGWAKSIWNVLLGPWSRGAEIVLHEGAFEPEERFDLIDRLGVTILCQSPTEYRLMAKLDELERHPLSRLRHAVSAGEPLNPEVIERFRDAFGLTIYDGYGQTENTLLVANTRANEVRPGSMGLPTPGHDVHVIGDDGQPAPAGMEGDIGLRGRPPSLFARYWRDRDETAAVFRGDWYVTGDRAVRDDDGYFWFTGRADDVITSAGYRIGPFEVESALLEHPSVAESAAIGKPDADRGEIVKAFVVLRPGIEPGDELAAELAEHAKRVTSPHKYPREIEFVHALPKTRSGKIRRVELRDLERERRPRIRDEAVTRARPPSAARSETQSEQPPPPARRPEPRDVEAAPPATDEPERTAEAPTAAEEPADVAGAVGAGVAAESWRERRARAKRERQEREQEIARARAAKAEEERIARERAAEAERAARERAAEEEKAARQRAKEAKRAAKAEREASARQPVEEAAPPPRGQGAREAEDHGEVEDQGEVEDHGEAEAPNPALLSRLEAYRMTPTQASAEDEEAAGDPGEVDSESTDDDAEA